MRTLLLVGRLLFGGFFVFSGLNHFMNAPMLAGYAASRGVPLATVAVLLTGVLLVVGGALVIAGFAPRVGLALIALFLVGVTPVMHAFWTMDDPAARTAETANFLKNVGLLGATIAMLAIPTPWPWSVGERAALRRPRSRALRWV